MGDFITAEEVKQRTRAPSLLQMDTDLMERRFVLLAERMIENDLRLNLNTDRQPRHFQARFTSDTNLEIQFQEDYKLAVVIVVERMVDNPQRHKTQSVKGASVVYEGGSIPTEARAMMQKWGRPRRVGRA